MELFDVRTLFDGNRAVMLASLLWMACLAICGMRDALHGRVPVVVCLSLLPLPIALLILGVIGMPHIIAAAIAAAVALAMWRVRAAGMGDALAIPAIVALLGALGAALVATGMFVAIMHRLMRRDGGDAQIPLVAYAALPTTIVLVIGYALVVTGLD